MKGKVNVRLETMSLPLYAPHTQPGHSQLQAAVQHARANLLALVWNAVSGWIDHRCSALAAALAFYALFALVPMLLIIIAVAGYFFGVEASSGQLFGQLRAVMGPDAAAFIQYAVNSAGKSPASASVGWVSVVAIAVSASVTFAELQAALNTIFVSKPTIDKPLLLSTWALVKARLVSVGLLTGLAFILIISLVLDSSIAALQRLVWQAYSLTFVIQMAQTAITLALLTLMFTALLRVLPDAFVSFSAAAWGALAAAVLFMVGKSLFGLYLTTLGSTDVFGAAGSLGVVLMWLFYSASVFLFGAEVAQQVQKRQASWATAQVLDHFSFCNEAVISSISASSSSGSNGLDKERTLGPKSFKPSLNS